MKKENQIIQTLLLVPGMGRKAVIKYIDEKGINCDESLKGVYDKLSSFAVSNKRIKVPDIDGFEMLYEEAVRIFKIHEREGIETISILDETYPKELGKLSDKPLLLFVKGDASLLNERRCTAVIGARDASEHGIRAGRKLGKILAEAGEIIVSGLAIGCDTCAHQGCLDANGKTIAFLPSPITNIQPAINRHLAQDIIDNGGLLVSEYYDGQKVQQGYYVERDRLQSGISDGVIVIETAVKGGTMHTVEFCIKQDKILACYKPPEEFNGKNTEGNIKLLEEGKAWGIGSKDDIDKYLEAVRMRRANMVISKDEGEQISLI